MVDNARQEMKQDELLILLNKLPIPRYWDCTQLPSLSLNQVVYYNEIHIQQQGKSAAVIKMASSFVFLMT